MLAGNPYARSNANTPESKAITWNWSVSFICTSVVTRTDSGPTTISIDFNGPPEPQTSGFANTNCPSGLRAQVFFPGCWDGKNLDSADHKSHMAYPDGIDNGICPSSHPVHLISIFYELYFSVKPFNDLGDGGRFVLSNGDPTGYGLHGDFMNGWDRSVLSRAVDECTNLSGVIEDCPVFQNEGRFYPDSVMNSCAAKNPLPDEQGGPGALLSHLPGCIAVTDGPAPATPADLVPGCVVGGASGSGMGSVSPVPSSPATSSASSSSAAKAAPILVDVARTSGSTTPSQSPASASPSQASHSSSSTPAMSAQPTTTTQMKSAPPSSSPSQASHSSSSKPATVAKPTTNQKKPAPSSALPGQASHSSSSSKPAMTSQHPTTQKKPAPSPDHSPCQEPHSSSSSKPAMASQHTTTQKKPAASSALPGQASHSSNSSKPPALVAESTTTQMKPASSPTLPSTSGGSSAGVPSPSPSTTMAHHGHGHGHQEDEDGCDEEPQSAHPTSSMLPRRRRHMKHGYRSPAHF